MFYTVLACFSALLKHFFSIQSQFQKQAGTSTTEAAVSFLVLTSLALGGIQTGLIYNAKAQVNLATFEAARRAATNHSDSKVMRHEIGIQLMPLYGNTRTNEDRHSSFNKAMTDLEKSAADNGAGLSITVINPTQEAFLDWGELDKNGKTYIPNHHLKLRPTTIGEKSKVTIQDANLLKIKVTYGYRLFIPLVDKLITSTLKITDPDNADFYNANRIPIDAIAVVRMHSDVYQDNNISMRGRETGDHITPEDFIITGPLPGYGQNLDGYGQNLDRHPLNKT